MAKARAFRPAIRKRLELEMRMSLRATQMVLSMLRSESELHSELV